MRRAALLWLLAAPLAHAQVIECPKAYPWEDTPLAEVPYQHKGAGMVMRAQLIGAGMFAGPWAERGELAGESAKVPGGTDTRFGFNQGDEKWLVCYYGKGGEIQWREQLDRAITGCTLQARGRGQVTARLVCTARPG